MEKPGTFARMHAQLLQKNNWDCIAQEILISTPRRFGKTISECPAPAAPHAVPVLDRALTLTTGVSMFCAALLLSCPSVEISIYSTCKRISQKILRNVMKFVMLICQQDLNSINCAILRGMSRGCGRAPAVSRLLKRAPV